MSRALNTRGISHGFKETNEYGIGILASLQWGKEKTEISSYEQGTTHKRYISWVQGNKRGFFFAKRPDLASSFVNQKRLEHL